MVLQKKVHSSVMIISVTEKECGLGWCIGQCEAVAKLVALGAEVEAQTAKGWTSLQLANMRVCTSSPPFSPSYI